MGICMPRKKPYMFERYEQKLVVFVFYGRFHELLPIVFGLKGEFNDLNTRYLFKSYDQKLVVFVIMAIFMSYCPQFFGSSWICKAYKIGSIFEIYD
jgi:hypothetical protein